MAFITARYGDDASDVSSIGQGEWSVAFSFRLWSEARVIRFSALDEDFRKDRLAARYTSPALPIPAVTEIGDAFGGFYAVSEYRPGSYLDDLDGTEMRALLPSLYALLDAAREVDLAHTTGYGIWGDDGNAPHQSWSAALRDVARDRPSDRTHGWRQRLRASRFGVHRFDEGFAALERLLPHCPAARHLVHSDLLHYNVLIATGRISAAIDWGCSLYGDFLYDLAWFCFWAPWYPAWQGIDFAAEARQHYAAIGLDVPHFAERLRAYQLHIGLDSQRYNVFRKRWDTLEAVTEQTLAIARTSTDQDSQFLH